jgi:hypothetical protein
MKYDERTNEFKVTCRWCKQEQVIDMSKIGDTSVVSLRLGEWTHGRLIQNAFPQLTNDERELIISQTCAKCWESLFSDSEDECERELGNEEDDDV